jgi:hypothetical protein
LGEALVAFIDDPYTRPRPPARRRGRPRVADSSARVDARIPSEVFDVLCREAQTLDVPLAQVVRDALEARATAFLSVSNRQAAARSAD